MNGGGNKTLALAAMIFAVAMTFIDQTIVSIAVPELQKDLGVKVTGTVDAATIAALEKAIAEAGAAPSASPSASVSPEPTPSS